MARPQNSSVKRKPETIVATAAAPPPEGAVPTAHRSTLASFAAIVDRLEQVVDTETEALGLSRPVDLALINRQKRQGLLELSRIMRALAGADAAGEARRRLDQLSGKLETNRLALDRQLRAVREVADIIALSIQEAESDGTYSQPGGRR